MAEGDAPFHAHVYYSDRDRAAAVRLRDVLAAHPQVLFVGRMMDRGVGPHPLPQFEAHFRKRSLGVIEPILEKSGLRVLIHPLTDDDFADHTSLARWIGEPVELNTNTLDPPGINQGVARFGKSDF